MDAEVLSGDIKEINAGTSGRPKECLRSRDVNCTAEA